MCKCKVESVLVAHVDNFSCLYSFSVPDEMVSSLVMRGVHDEGYLFQCPKCGEFNYMSEEAYDSMIDALEDKKILDSLKGKLKKLSKMDVTIDSEIESLKSELGDNLEGFLKKNGKLLGLYHLNDETDSFYKLRDTFTNEELIIKYVRDCFGQCNLYKVVTSA